jgi:hypothetical protein
MAHGYLSLFAIGVLNNHNWLRHIVLSLIEGLYNSSANLWIRHDTMLLKEGVFENGTNNITSRNEVALAQAFKWLEIPKFVLIKIWKLDTSWDEHVLIS